MDCPDIIDFEASGFGSASYPIEVGYCLSNQDRFCSLIRPDDSWVHWDKSAESIHGISRGTLLEVGQDAKVVCARLNERLKGRTLYSDAWVSDKSWLNRLYEVGGCRPSFQLCAIEYIQTERQHLIWDRVRHRMLKEAEFSRHRASSDAHFIQQLFLKSRELSKEYGSGNFTSFDSD